MDLPKLSIVPFLHHISRLPLAGASKILLLFAAAACEARWILNYHLSTSTFLTSAHVDGRRLNPMVD
jgi:hypothetical protein